jgi:hypothetical protein
MEFSASQIALIIKGSVEGNPNATVNSSVKLKKPLQVSSLF